MEISQNDGKIQVYAADMWLKGGIDGNGEFWAGGQRTSAMDRNSMLRHLLTGRFRNESQFQYSLRSSLIINGSVKNTTMESGARRLMPRWTTFRSGRKRIIVNHCTTDAISQILRTYTSNAPRT